MILLPLLGQSEVHTSFDFMLEVAKSLIAVVAIYFLFRLVVPKVLAGVARVGNKEHLTLSVVLIILFTGWVSQEWV